MRRNIANTQPDAGVSFDTLLAFAGGTLTRSQAQEVAAHLANSPSDQAVLEGIQYYLEDEATNDHGLNAYLDDMACDIDAMLDIYESEKAFLADEDEETPATTCLYEQAVEATEFAREADRVQGNDHTGIRFAYTLGEANEVKAVVLSSDAAAFLHVVSGRAADMIWHPLAFVDARCSADGHTLLTQSTDFTLRLWQDGQEQAGLPHEAPVLNKQFAAHGRQLLTAAGRKVYLWDTHGQLLQQYLHPAPICFSRFVCKDNRILSGDSQGELRLWDLPGMLYRRFQHPAALAWGSVSHSGRQVLGITAQAQASLWDIEENERWRMSGVRSGNFVAKQPQLLFVMQDATARLWNLFGNELNVFPHAGPLHTAFASPDGRQVLTASADTTACVWESNGKRLLELKHPYGVQWALWCGQEAHILTLCQDQSLRLWRKDGQLLSCLAAPQWPKGMT